MRLVSLQWVIVDFTCISLVLIHPQKELRERVELGASPGTVFCCQDTRYALLYCSGLYYTRIGGDVSCSWPRLSHTQTIAGN
jgi:hypothetical protein